MKKNLIITILAVMTALLAAAVIVLACLYASQKDGGNLSAHQQYYNAKCSSYRVQNANLSKGQIVFIGDSITDLYVLDDHYADLPLATYNRGIGGDTTQGVLNRLQVSIFDVAPSVVVLMIGTNDVNGGVANDQILRNYEQIVDSIYAALPSVKLYCMSIIPQADSLQEYTNINVSATTATIMQLNPRVQALAESKGATYLDLFSLLADSNNRLIAEYTDDGIHLNATGLAVWTSLLKPYLQQE